MIKSNIQYVTGDATEPIGTGNRIIAHVCNDVGAWGAGFVLAISRRWPQPREEYLRLKQTKGLVLGTVGLVHVEEPIWVANMIAQHGLQSDKGTPPIRYEALQSCLATVARHAGELSATVHMPRIGCGLAGGRWKMVEPIIRDVLLPSTQVFVYDL